MKNIFISEENILENIEKFLKGITPQETVLNTFEYKGIKYQLDDNICQKILTMISDLPIAEKEKIVLQKYRFTALLSKIREMVKHIIKDFLEDKKCSPIIRTYFLIINKANYDQLARVINDIISYYMVEHLWTKTFDKNPKFLMITFAELSFHLGTACLHWWFNYVKEEKLHRKHPELRDNYKVKRSQQSKEFLNWYQDVNEQFKNITKLKGKSTFLNNFSINTLKVKNFEKLSITVGAYFVDHLLNNQILTEIDRDELTKKRATVITLNEVYEESITRATSYYKPILTSKKEQVQDVILEDKDKQYKFMIKNASSLSDNTKFVYKKEQALEDCINANEVTYCINTPFFDYYLQYFSYIYNLDWKKVINEPDSNEAIEIVDFLLITFNINIKDLRLNIENNKILILLEYIKDTEKIFNITLSKKLNKDWYAKGKSLKAYLDNPKEKRQGMNLKQFLENTKIDLKYEKYIRNYEKSKLLLDCYNKIAAQKYFIINFLRDAYIYKHFKFFYLEKKITSIARLQYLSFFLSLQTNKFGRAFLMYYVREKQITDTNFEQYKQILSDNLTHVKTKLDNMTYANFIETSKKCQEEYILSYFSKDTKINDLLSIKFNEFQITLNSILKNNVFKNTNTALLSISLLYYI